MGFIYFMDDDKKLVEQAKFALESRSTHNFYEVDISQATKEEYLRSLDLMAHDLVVLDLKLVGVPSTGLDVLEVLHQEKKKGHLLGLEQVLIATSAKKQVDPKDVYPAIAFAEGFKVYGMEKGVDPTRQVSVIDYVSGLMRIVDRIYAGTEKPLNQPH